jgi:hypothetical protein
MSETLTKVVVDCSTGVSEILPLTAEEIVQYNKDQEKFAKERADKDAQAEALATLKASAESKLAALGLTADEIVALSK